MLNNKQQITNQVVVPGRLELPTSTLSVWRSNQLSYRTVGDSRSSPRHDARPHLISCTVFGKTGSVDKKHG